MPKVKGSLILLEVEDPTAPGTFIVCAGQDNLDLNRALSTTETSTKESYVDGFSEYEAGLLNWNVSLSGAIEIDDQGFDKLDDAFLAKEPIQVRVVKVNGKQYTGKGLITNFTFNAPMENAKYTIDIQGTGVLSKSATA